MERFGSMSFKIERNYTVFQILLDIFMNFSTFSFFCLGNLFLVLSLFRMSATNFCDWWKCTLSWNICDVLLHSMSMQSCFWSSYSAMFLWLGCSSWQVMTSFFDDKCHAVKKCFFNRVLKKRVLPSWMRTCIPTNLDFNRFWNTPWPWYGRKTELCIFPCKFFFKKSWLVDCGNSVISASFSNMIK